MIDYTGKDQSWWPNLKGRTVAILASGPSMNQAQANACRDTDWHVIAINATWRLAPWAHTLYGCDWHWWRSGTAPLAGEYRGRCVVGHLPKAKGGRALPPDMQWQATRLHYAPVRVGHNSLILDSDHIGSGSNSAFQAANLAARWGARRLLLFGVDCHSPNRRWHGAHKHAEAPIPTETTCATWIASWRNAAPQFASLGISVINCSPGSALRSFPCVPVDNLLRTEAA